MANVNYPTMSRAEYNGLAQLVGEKSTNAPVRAIKKKDVDDSTHIDIGIAFCELVDIARRNGEDGERLAHKIVERYHGYVRAQEALGHTTLERLIGKVVKGMPWLRPRREVLNATTLEVVINEAKAEAAISEPKEEVEKKGVNAGLIARCVSGEDLTKCNEHLTKLRLDHFDPDAHPKVPITDKLIEKHLLEQIAEKKGPLVAEAVERNIFHGALVR